MEVKTVELGKHGLEDAVEVVELIISPGQRLVQMRTRYKPGTGYYEFGPSTSLLTFEQLRKIDEEVRKAVSIHNYEGDYPWCELSKLSEDDAYSVAVRIREYRENPEERGREKVRACKILRDSLGLDLRNCVCIFKHFAELENGGRAFMNMWKEKE